MLYAHEKECLFRHKVEPVVGYSRAGRVGSNIHVSGTTATDEVGRIVGKGDPYLQAVQAARNMESALNELDSGLRDVVRTHLRGKILATGKKLQKPMLNFLVR
jgi:enamine deaminase RidA (YjgF/YER057c/UK114 family)